MTVTLLIYESEILAVTKKKGSKNFNCRDDASEEFSGVHKGETNGEP
jgi:hypothetical protein